MLALVLAMYSFGCSENESQVEPIAKTTTSSDGVFQAANTTDSTAGFAPTTAWLNQFISDNSTYLNQLSSVTSNEFLQSIRVDGADGTGNVLTYIFDEIKNELSVQDYVDFTVSITGATGDFYYSVGSDVYVAYASGGGDTVVYQYYKKKKDGCKTNKRWICVIRSGPGGGPVIIGSGATFFTSLSAFPGF